MTLQDGFFIIDKPQGITSFGVIAWLRKIFGVRKIGHAGTLDPMATGILVVAVGKATKQLQHYVGLDKEYEAEMKFGWVSDTDDSSGKLEEHPCKSFSAEELKKILILFSGKIEQIPPQFSALKIDGQRAYKLARKGQRVELKPRSVHIYNLELLDFSWPFARIRVSCSTGTYIRALIRDIGSQIGCGAVMTALRRTRVGEYTLDQAVSIDDLYNRIIVP